MARRQDDQRFFTLDYWRDGRWYVGKLREVPGVFSQGRTLKELVTNIADAYKLMVEENQHVPAPNYRSKQVGIAI